MFTQNNVQKRNFKNFYEVLKAPLRFVQWIGRCVEALRCSDVQQDTISLEPFSCWRTTPARFCVLLYCWFYSMSWDQVVLRCVLSSSILHYRRSAFLFLRAALLKGAEVRWIFYFQLTPSIWESLVSSDWCMWFKSEHVQHKEFHMGRCFRRSYSDDIWRNQKSNQTQDLRAERDFLLHHSAGYKREIINV